MKLNQQGGTLVTVLLVILVFSVLGFTLMGSVVSENKRTYKTESNMQARYLAESGLTYFEKDFKNFINKNLTTITLNGFYNYLNTNFIEKNNSQNEKYKTGVIVESNPDSIVVRAELIELASDPVKKITTDGRANAKEKMVKVTSTAIIGSSDETLIGYYKPALFFDIDSPAFPLPNFDGLAVDFTKKDVLGLDLLSLINLDLIDPTGIDKTFYRVPDDKLIGVGLLFDLVGLNLLGTDRFKTMEKHQVVATRQGEVLGLDVLKGKKASLLTVNLLEFPEEKDTNVIIDGGFTALSLIWLIQFDDYRDIHFKKLGVLGNAVIKQDRRGLFINKDNAPSRQFSFQEGLFVNKSLIIGGYQGDNSSKSNLILNGNMLAMKDLYINYVNLEIGDSVKEETIYVYNNASINNACINKESTNTKKFRLLAKGSITLENNTSCNEFKGLFYAEKGIMIKTNNQPMTIRGRVIGDVTIDYPDKLTYIPDDAYLGNITLKDIKLISKGRLFQ